MRQALDRLGVDTPGQGFVDITGALSDCVARHGIANGLLTIWCRHTSASLLVQENADPAVRADLQAFLRHLAPEGATYRHAEEGPDDMPAHIRAALMPTHLCVPVQAGRLALGTWQAVYLVEHRRAPHQRELALHLIGE
ncbi:MAG: YjbQ family protein [Acetobacteraceae bacterium]|nr:YjbQ family protein [Acetobacteraceae bacterium]